MTEKTELKIALCWYSREAWEHLKQVATDKEALDDTYEEWKRNANQAIQELHTQGQQIQKVSIKIDQLVRWCETEDLENNMAARSRYAGVMLEERTS